MECKEPVEDLYYGGRSAEYDANVKKLAVPQDISCVDHEVLCGRIPGYGYQ